MINLSKYSSMLVERIVKRNGKFVVTNESGTKVLGTHDSYKKAKAQLDAIEISKHKNN